MTLVRGVVHQDVQPTKSLHCLLDRLAAKRGVADIAGKEKYALPQLVNLIAQLDGVALLFFEVHDGDIGAFTGEEIRDGAANTRVPAGHERHLVN